MRIRRTADVQVEGDKEVIATIQMGGGSWQHTDYTRREQKAFGNSVALMAQIIAEVYAEDLGCNCLVAMREGLKDTLQRVRDARKNQIIVNTP